MALKSSNNYLDPQFPNQFIFDHFLKLPTCFIICNEGNSERSYHKVNNSEDSKI